MFRKQRKTKKKKIPSKIGKSSVLTVENTLSASELDFTSFIRQYFR